MVRVVKVDDDDYILELQKIDSRVYDNKGGTRPYIGFLFEVDGTKFIAPLTSPKQKHLKWTNSKKDIYLIDGGKKGVLQLSNMIPVKQGLYSDLTLQNDDSYHTLLQSQFIDVDNNKQKIKEKAERLLNLNKKNSQHYELRNCCDFQKLKVICDNYTVK